jgi:hypothetical protein
MALKMKLRGPDGSLSEKVEANVSVLALDSV